MNEWRTKMKKKFIYLFLTTTLLTVSFIPVCAEPLNHNAISQENEISPHADIIEWRYKTINGKLYRRQYNYTKQMWIGNWELV